MAGKNVLQIVINADDKTKAALRDATVAVGAFGAAVTAAFGVATAKSIEFQRGMAEIQTLLGSGATPAIARMSNELMKLAVQSGQSLGSLTKARYDIISAGFSDAASSAAVLEASVKVAQGGLVDAGVAADLMTTAINGMGLAASDAERVADVLFTTVRMGKTTMTELGASFGQVFATARTAGVSLEEVGAAMAVITAQGIATPRAATAINSLMLALAAPSKEAKVQLDALGISLDDGLVPALAALSRAGEEGLDKLQALIPNIEALRAAAAGGADVDKLNAALNAMVNSSGAASEAAGIMGATMSEQLSRIRSGIEVIAVRFGDALAPAANKAANALERVVVQLSELPDGVLQATAVIGGIAGALALAASSAGALVLAISSVAKVLAALKVSGAVAALFATISSAAAAPIVAGALGIAATVATVNAVQSFADEAARKRQLAAARASIADRGGLDMRAVFAPRSSGSVQTRLGSLDIAARGQAAALSAGGASAASAGPNRSEAIGAAMKAVEALKQSVEGQFAALMGTLASDTTLFAQALIDAGDPAGLLAEVFAELEKADPLPDFEMAISLSDALDGAAEAAKAFSREYEEIVVQGEHSGKLGERMIAFIDLAQQTAYNVGAAFGDAFGQAIVYGEKFGAAFKRIFDQIKASLLSLIANKALFAILKLALGSIGGPGALAISFLGLSQGTTRVPGFAGGASGFSAVPGLPGADLTPALLSGGEMVLNESRANSLRHALFMPGRGGGGRLDKLRQRSAAKLQASLVVKSPLSIGESIELSTRVSDAQFRSAGLA